MFFQRSILNVFSNNSFKLFSLVEEYNIIFSPRKQVILISFPNIKPDAYMFLESCNKFSFGARFIFQRDTCDV